MAGGRRGGRGNVGERRRNTRRDEEFELMYGEGTQGPMTGIEWLFPWNQDANKRNAIAQYNKYHLDEGTTPIPFPDKSGMITGAWDKAKEIGGEWWKNISSDKGEYRREFDAKWLKKLGHSGLPRLENYIGESAEADFDRDWREYWDTHPDNLSLY